MTNIFLILKKVNLFAGISENDVKSMLSCLSARVIKTEKNEYLLMAGDPVAYIGIVLSGTLHIEKDDAEGGRTMIASLSTGDYFAEALCCAGVKESPVNVVVDTGGTVMLIEFKKIMSVCPNSCIFHSKLIENMLGIIARKNLMLQNRMEIIGKRSLRLKIMCYLESLSSKTGGKVEIPFNREELADFLCVDRSALSHELSRMKNEGLIDYKKNMFSVNKR